MMYQMMGSGFGAPILFGSIGYLAILIGIAFLVIWTVKNLHGDQLKKAGMWCVLAGVALLLLGTIVSVRSGARSYRESPRGWPVQGGYSELNFR